MCAQNKIKKGNKALSYLFCTHLAITISAIVSGRWHYGVDRFHRNWHRRKNSQK